MLSAVSLNSEAVGLRSGKEGRGGGGLKISVWIWVFV
jgi:hypothetical protein